MKKSELRQMIKEELLKERSDAGLDLDDYYTKTYSLFEKFIKKMKKSEKWDKKHDAHAKKMEKALDAYMKTVEKLGFVEPYLG
jgi:vacuolar-type H+-ATPase catalytic subunit A/Vma1